MTPFDPLTARRAVSFMRGLSNYSDTRNLCKKPQNQCNQIRLGLRYFVSFVERLFDGRPKTQNLKSKSLRGACRPIHNPDAPNACD